MVGGKLDPVHATVMGFIFVTSAVGLAIVFERFRVIRSASSIRKDELLNHINSYILQGQLDKAVQVTSQHRNPLTNIIRAGLVTAQNGKSSEEVQTAMDAVALREIPRLERRIPMLAMLSNVATLLGLVGTVSGMIGAFGAVGNVPAAQKATMLAGAIAEALQATLSGLVIGVALLCAFGWLQDKAQEAVDDIHESSVATLNLILSNREKILRRSS